MMRKSVVHVPRSWAMSGMDMCSVDSLDAMCGQGR